MASGLSSNPIGKGGQRFVDTGDRAKDREDFVAIELLLKGRSSRGAIREDADVVSLISGHAGGGIDADAGDHAGEHHIFDASFLQQTVESGIRERTQALLSWQLNNSITELLQRIDGSRAGGGFSERAQLLDGLQNPNRIFKFSVIIGEGDGGGYHRHAREQRPFQQAKGVGKHISVVNFFTNRTVQQSVRTEEIILITDKEDGCFCGIHLHV